MDFLPLQTARLALRRFRTDDLAAFQAYRSDPELARYQGWQPVSDERALSFLAEQAEQVLGAAGQWLQVAVARLEGGELIGDLGLCVVDAEEGVLELGFTLARSMHGQGYAGEAVSSVLEALLSKGRVRSAVAVTDSRNRASVALLERLGFSLEHTGAAVFKDEPCVEHRFVLSAREWARRRAR